MSTPSNHQLPPRLFAIAGFVFATTLALAPAGVRAAGSSTIISTTLAPVRVVTVDHNGHVTSIDTNSQDYIKPVFHLDGESGPVTRPSVETLREYSDKLSNLNGRLGITHFNNSLPQTPAGLLVRHLKLLLARIRL